MAKEPEKCAHPGCKCRALEGDKYCSPYCRDTADKTEITCNCGHIGCGTGHTAPAGSGRF